MDSEWPFKFRAYGRPITKGGNFVVIRNRAIPKHSHKIKRWEAVVRQAWMDSDPPDEELDEPVEVYLKFYVKRPKKPRFPVPAVYPDIDKLARCALDALQRKKIDGKVIPGLYKDDARIVSLGVEMAYASEDEPEGCMVIVCPLSTTSTASP